MELVDAILTRRSIRSFKSKSIADETIFELLELANKAPSAGNIQARDFIVVKDKAKKMELVAAALGQAFIAEAPVVVVVCGNMFRTSQHYGKRGNELYSIQDADAAIQTLILAIHSKGFGTCWVGAFNEAAVCAVLDLPEGVRPLAILPIGYPAEKPTPTSRINIKKLVHIDRW